jgi:hypothetical protein
MEECLLAIARLTAEFCSTSGAAADDDKFLRASLTNLLKAVKSLK